MNFDRLLTALALLSFHSDAKLLGHLIGGSPTKNVRSRKVGNITYERPFPSVSEHLNYDASRYLVDSLPGLEADSFRTQHWAGQIPIPYAGEDHYGSLFFWLFEPDQNVTSNTPIVIWSVRNFDYSYFFKIFIHSIIYQPSYFLQPSLIITG